MAQAEVDTLPRKRDGSVDYEANKSNIAYHPSAFTMRGRVD
jgi:hypothetical protein